jgi:glycosyltransferase involved in cell wall biosynthesis
LRRPTQSDTRANGKRPRILILCYSDPNRDPRVRRQIDALRDDFEVVVAGLVEGSVDGGVRALPISRSLPSSLRRKARRAGYFFTRRFGRFYWDPTRTGFLRDLAASEGPFDVVLANDIATLPLALAAAGGAGRVVFDAHEFYPDEFSGSGLWKVRMRPYVRWMCDTYLAQANCVTTVSNGIAGEYRRRFGIDSTVVSNAAPYHDLTPSPVGPGPIQLVHHGAAIPARRIERMIDSMKFLGDDYELTLMLVRSRYTKRYFEQLEGRAEPVANVRFREPVPITRLCDVLNGYDLGVYLLPVNGLNDEYALPNKLFEFMQARLAVAVSPNPEMAGFVRELDLGVVTRDFTPEAMAEAIRGLSRRDIERHKECADRAARAVNAEDNATTWRSVMRALAP